MEESRAQVRDVELGGGDALRTPASRSTQHMWSYVMVPLPFSSVRNTRPDYSDGRAAGPAGVSLGVSSVGPSTSPSQIQGCP